MQREWSDEGFEDESPDVWVLVECERRHDALHVTVESNGEIIAVVRLSDTRTAVVVRDSTRFQQDHETHTSP